MTRFRFIGCLSEFFVRHLAGWGLSVIRSCPSCPSYLPIQQAVVPTGSILDRRDMSYPTLRRRERFLSQYRLVHPHRLVQILRSIHRTKPRTRRSAPHSKISCSYRFSGRSTRQPIASLSYTTSAWHWMRRSELWTPSLLKTASFLAWALLPVCTDIFPKRNNRRLALNNTTVLSKGVSGKRG
jgi:hypothetical protein